MHTYRYRVSLRIWHPSDDPNTYTSTLELEPQYVDVVGQRRFRKGKALELLCQESYWSHQFDTDDGEQDIGDYLLGKVGELAVHLPFFHGINASGGRAELFVGFFVEAPNCGIVLSPELQRKCAELHLTLAFDIYGLVPEPSDGPNQ